MTVGDKPCTDLRIIKPFKAFTCVMPKCLRCGTLPLVVTAPGIGLAAGQVTYAFQQQCYIGDLPLLPPRGSAEETCVVCKQLVGAALNLLGDAASSLGIRNALAAACNSGIFKSFARTDEVYCRIDLSTACTLLYHSSGQELADAMWARWQSDYLFGTLPASACAMVSRCPPPQLTPLMLFAPVQAAPHLAPSSSPTPSPRPSTPADAGA